MTTGPKKSKTPRNQKRHWRKGTNLDDVEEFMQIERVEQSEGGPLRERDDSQIFAIDRLPEDPSEKLTRKQTAVVNKLKLLQEAEVGSDAEDVKPSKDALKRNFPKKKSRIARVVKKSKSKSESESAKPYDLWAEEEKKPVSAEVALAEDHFMRTTKRRKPNEPKTVKHVTSLLPSVEVAEAGASYNPSLTHYQKYVENIAKDEVGVVRSEERIEKAVKLAAGQTYATEEERMAEESAGLFDEKEEEEHEPEQQSNKEEETKKPKVADRKTKKKRRAEELNRKKQIAEQSEKGTKNVEQHIYKVKKLNKEVSEELSNVAKKANLRRKKKSLKRLLGTQQLGGGKFKPEEQPFLLTEELSGSLRTLKPQGDVLGDRLKSLQKRNMMPVPGEEKVRSKLKQKLRVKLSERRSHKDVKLGSRVI